MLDDDGRAAAFGAHELGGDIGRSLVVADQVEGKRWTIQASEWKKSPLQDGLVAVFASKRSHFVSPLSRIASSRQHPASRQDTVHKEADG